MFSTLVMKLSLVGSNAVSNKKKPRGIELRGLKGERQRAAPEEQGMHTGCRE